MSRVLAVLLTGFGLAATGCVHTGSVFPKHKAPIPVPAPGTVPTELSKENLPEYVIEPPDVLWLQVAQIAKVGKDDKDAKNPDGTPKTDQLRSLPLQAVQGDHTVRPDGTIYLGVYGSIPVSGYTLSQAAMVIRETLAKQIDPEASGVKPENLVVILDVAQYNSKRYYVIFDGGGAGEQVFPFPITGSETVLDAIANVNGLPVVASKRNIWVARRCPMPGHPEQILPVDWVGVTQHGVTATNYQIMPGDRVYVKAQRLVTVDTTLARIIAPIERLFGVTLLGATTVNQIAGRGQGFNNP
jgi:polysaccharide export outer membrane protein